MRMFVLPVLEADDVDGGASNNVDVDDTAGGVEVVPEGFSNWSIRNCDSDETIWITVGEEDPVYGSVGEPLGPLDEMNNVLGGCTIFGPVKAIANTGITVNVYRKVTR